jgi:hypothetical protein
MSDCHVPLALQADALSRRVAELQAAAAELKQARSVVVVGGGEVGAVRECVQYMSQHLMVSVRCMSQRHMGLFGTACINPTRTLLEGTKQAHLPLPFSCAPRHHMHAAALPDRSGPESC